MSQPTLLPASTILLVRDAPGVGLEVLMVERHHQIDFASGALVFPGGKVSKEDSDPRWADLCDGAGAEEDRAYRIAAVREAFEESGILLARPANARGAGKPMVKAHHFEAASAQRDAIAKNEASFLEAVQAAGLVLALDTLVFYAHWITPEGMPKRFDTRFYIAETPDEQIELCDGSETVDACWITPEGALTALKEGRRKIIFPTRLNIELLAKSSTADAAIEASRSRKIVVVTPFISRGPEGAMLNIPAEAGYSVTRETIEGNLA